MLPFTPAPPYVVTMWGKVREKSSGLWKVPLPVKTGTKDEGLRIRTWTVQVPSGAVAGQRAWVIVKVRTTLGSTVYTETATCKIRIGY